MNYTVYSFAALSPLSQAGQAKPGAKEEESRDAVEVSGTLKLTGSARISGIGHATPWYRRLYRRLFGGPATLAVNDRIEFELVFRADANQSMEGTGLADLRTQLGLTPSVASAVIEVFVQKDAERASKINPVGKSTGP